MAREIRPWPDLLPAVGLATHFSRPDPNPTEKYPHGHYFGWQIGSTLFVLPVVYSIGKEAVEYVSRLF